MPCDQSLPLSEVIFFTIESPPSPLRFIWGEQGNRDRSTASILSLALPYLPVGVCTALSGMGVATACTNPVPRGSALFPVGARGLPNAWIAGASPLWAGPEDCLLCPDSQPHLQVLDCYFEAYQHALDPEERFALAQVITDVMYRAPRFDLSHPYFIKAYRDERACLRLHLQLLRAILNQHVSTASWKGSRVSLAGVARLAGAWPMHRRVLGSIPSQGIYIFIQVTRLIPGRGA